MKPTDIDNRSFLAKIAHRLHSVIAKSPYVAQKYIYLWSKVARSLPENKFKNQIVNSFRNIDWQGVSFEPQQVWAGTSADRVDLWIVPHPGEFDFEVMFSQNIRYETEVFNVLASRLSKYDLIVEIGANVGIFTVFFGRYIQKNNLDCRVYAFEPSCEAFFRLQQNVRANQLKNIQIFNFGIAQNTGFLKFTVLFSLSLLQISQTRFVLVMHCL
ncbi:MAG: FkbM family methyltransferase [Oscillatoriales cyanobacterium SM2_1_8]|nr:FkbM family methyltransferase [Oscillatoriales cyanobacterium SM2_1_8]